MSDEPSTSSGLSAELIALQRVVAGRYSIVRELGRGGMGIVFLARDAALERPVAIKLLPPLLAQDPIGRARFVREARIAARLSHPNIVPIHSVEEHDELAFFVMRFVDGETLADRVARTGPLPIDEAMRVTQELAWALAHSHGHGVVHRDVKPDNILLERDTGRAIVTDFGIARADDRVMTSATGAIVGTPRYMSPEQACGEPLDGRSDLYSLGAVAYFATTGRAPIDGESAAAILARKCIVAPPSLASARGGLPPKFVSAIDRCLAIDPAARWPSAEDLAGALQTASSGHEIALPIRQFWHDSSGAGAEVAAALTAAGISFVAALVSSSGDGLDAVFGAVGYLAIASSMVGLAGIRLARFGARARRLLEAGYAHPAIRQALVMSEHETAGDDRPAASGWRVAATLALGAAGTAASFFLIGIDVSVLQFLGFAGTVAIPTMAIRRALEQQGGTDGWWSRLVRGSIGRSIFRLAGIGLSKRIPRLPAAGEPTSLAIRTELTELFAALPRAQRGSFADLPALAVRLERQAEALRDRTPNPETDRRLQSVVAALEILRLDLRRLSADAVDTGDLTRDLDEARAISDEIEARLEANAEVRRLLRPETP